MDSIDNRVERNMDARQNTSERETAELWPSLQSDKVFKAFRSQFIGKSSPVHFFWGSFDLALTFFSGRRAPERPGADRMTREAYSHEVISCGFWPGDDRFPAPAFYSYTAPEPPGLPTASIRPEEAFYSQELSLFLLRYDDVQTASSPEQALLEFFQSTYEAGARLAQWDREALEQQRRRTSQGRRAKPRDHG